MATPKSLMPHPRVPVRKAKRLGPALTPVIVCALVIGVGFFSLPSVLAIDLKVADAAPAQNVFPVTVDPVNKTITENPQVDALLNTRPTSLSAAAGTVAYLFTKVAVFISKLSAYRQIAGANTLFITIQPGYREEQVAYLIGNTLGWTAKQRTQFIALADARDKELPDGGFVPGTYFLSVTDPAGVENLLHDRFQKEILDRYSAAAQKQLPIEDALTVASLIERESGGWDDMRLISGIIWNRTFIGMNLQIDATLQYAKANPTTVAATGTWWQPVYPKDMYIKSPYNTYTHAGLPPGPIANPSVAAVIAALNPKKTDCMFYFHDSHGNFHCSVTYAQHVALLKKYYGRGS
jgi:UPF0755 protein